MPLLPVALLVIIATLIADPIGKSYPDTVHALDMPAIVESNRLGNSGQQVVASIHLQQYGTVKARLTIPSAYNELSTGDSIKFSCRLVEPAPRTSQENDYSGILRTQGIIYSGFVPPDSISITGSSQSLYWRIRRLQPLAGELLRRSNLSSEACEFLIATLTGDTSILTEDTRHLFSSAGIAHVLALSGLHVGILVAVIAIALFPLYALRLRRTRLLLTIILLWGYAVFTGLSPSVTRAVIMATALSGGLILQRRYFGINGLLLAACVIIIASPLQLYQPGFQMSFISVASILAISPLINRIDRKRRLLFAISSLTGVSIAATIGTGIVSAYYFHTFPLLFLIANIPVLAVMPFIMGAGLILIAIEAAGIDPQWLCTVIDLLYKAIHAIASAVASLPCSTIDNLYFPGWIAIPYYLAVTALIAYLYLRKKIILTTSMIMAITTVSCFAITQPTNAEEEIFLTHDTYSTTCIYRHRDKAYLMTTANGSNTRTLIDKYHRTYSDYLGKHGIDSITVAPDNSCFGSIKRDGALTVIGSRRYLTVAGNALPDPGNIHDIDCAVICRGFRGDVIDIFSEYHPDSIILSNDLHPRRHDRYADSLTIHNISFRSLKKK